MSKTAPPLMARFQPQAEQGGYDVPIDGARDFEVGRIILAMSAGDFRDFWRQTRKTSGIDLDNLAYRNGEVTKAHHGPFIVSLDPDRLDGWLGGLGLRVDDINSVTDRVMDGLRREWGVKKYRQAGEVRIAAVEMQDWRVVDGDDDELSEDQKAQFPVRLMRRPGGLVMEIDGPRGTRHTVGFEIDHGNFRIIPYTNNKDEVDLILSLTAAGLHVSTDGQSGGFMVEDGRLTRAEDTAPPSFADGPAPRP